MNYDARDKVIKEVESDVDYVMSFFPKDYSDKVLTLIRANVKSAIRKRMSEYKNAFCEDNNLCPLCITGGWECGSDHK